MVIVQFKQITKDSIALKLLIVIGTICLLSYLYRFSLGILFTLVFIVSLSVIHAVKQNGLIQKRLQEIIATILKTRSTNTNQQIKSDQRTIFIAKGLNDRIETFFEHILDNFINNWYKKVSRDESFVPYIKLELTYAVRKLALKYKNVDYPSIISTKLLPIFYQHFSQLEHSIDVCENNEQLIKSFIENGNPIHPATYNRKAELQYLRALSESLMSNLLSTSNFNCRPAYDFVRELLTNWVFLQLTDIISDPDIINQLVILATNSKTTTIHDLKEYRDVELLENFIKSAEVESNLGKRYLSERNFFCKDQQKLYNFMQHLKNKCTEDVDILKFVLDVEHLNTELENINVICDPVRLSSLQQTSEKLLLHYRDSLYRGNADAKPNDLIESYNHARKYLEYKWKNEFYKSAEYYKYIYGDREIFNVCNQEKEDIPSDMQISNQKLTAKIRNAMSMKIAVDGIEEDNQIWEANDVAASNSPIHYYNSMSVKLRKERGQDLEGFMQTLFQSIEQEADMGEDIVQTQIKERQRNRIVCGNTELYQNLFNISGQSTCNQYTLSSFIKNPTQSLLYFLAKIIKIPQIILRIITSIVYFLPDFDALVCMAIRRLAEKLINQAILAHLIKELEEKIFESKSHQATELELKQRKILAMERLENIKKGLSSNLLFLQNPSLNKHLIYSCLDIIVLEGFNELNPNS